MKELLQILTRDTSLKSRGTVYSFFFFCLNSSSVQIVIALMLLWISQKSTIQERNLDEFKFKKPGFCRFLTDLEHCVSLA